MTSKPEHYEARAEIFDRRASGERENGFVEAAKRAEAAAIINRQHATDLRRAMARTA